MAFRPISKANRKTRPRIFRHRARLTQYHGSWETWQWKPERKNLWGLSSLSPKRKKGILLCILLFIGIFFAVDQLFKRPVAAECHYASNDRWVGCSDPLTYIWSATSPNHDLTEFNAVRVTWDNTANNLRFVLAPNGTQSAIALSKSPIGDLGIISAKQMFLRYEYQVSGSCCGGINNKFGVYLTTNGTLPTQLNYNPYTDSSVALLTQTYATGPGTFFNAFFIQRSVGGSIVSQDSGGCSPTSSCLVGASDTIDPTMGFDTVGLVLNFTTQGPLSTACQASVNPFGGPGCSWMAKGPTTNVPPTFNFFTQQVPWFKFQGQQYYMGFYSLAANSAFSVLYQFEHTNANPSPNTLHPNDIAYYVPGASCPGQANAPCSPDTGGFFGPLITGLIQFGLWFFQTAIPFLQNMFTQILNLIGTIWGDSQFGTHTINFLIQFFTFLGDGVTGLGAAFTNFINLFTVFYNSLKVTFPWLPIAISIALNLGTLAINGIGEAITLVSLAMTLIVGGFSFYILLFFFIYVGDDALGGVLAWLETVEWLLLGLGVKWTVKILNLGLDVITYIVGLTPKPFIQMIAHQVPRLPILEVNARFVPPSFDFGEARAGNIFVFALWSVGIDFLAWYESRNPALPGSIAALVPSALNSTLVLNNMLPFFNLIVLITWGAMIAWLGTVPFSVIGYDLTGSLPLTVGPGRQISGGPGKISVSKAEKRFQGRVKAKIKGREEREKAALGRGRSLFIASGGLSKQTPSRAPFTKPPPKEKASPLRGGSA